MSTEQNNGKPAVPPKRNLLNNRRIRLLLSLLGAVIAWMAVTIVVQPGTTTTIYNVPVDFTYDSAAYTSRGLSIVNAEEKTGQPEAFRRRLHHRQPVGQRLCRLPRLVQRPRQRRKEPAPSGAEPEHPAHRGVRLHRRRQHRGRVFDVVEEKPCPSR